MQENISSQPVVTEQQLFRFKIVTYFLLLVVIIVLGITILVFTNQFSSKKQVDNSFEANPTELSEVKNSQPIGAEIKPITSSYKAYVDIVPTGLVSVFPLDSTYEKYTLSEYNLTFPGGSLGLGETGFSVAPDLEKFAVLNSDSRTVTVHAVDKSIKIELPIANVLYINSWSLDSSKLLVYVTPNTIQRSFENEGMQAPPDLVTVNQNPTMDGFILVDFEAGTIREMFELDGMLVYYWSGNDTLVVSKGLGQNEEFIHYSLSEKIADRKKISALNDVFGTQMSFSRDGKKWSTVTSVDKTDINMAQVTIGNFPNFGDIAKLPVPWARRQGPVLSPSGSVVALTGQEVLNGPFYVYLYNGTDIEQITEGRPRFWVDDSQLIFTKESRAFLYNLDTKAIREL